MEEVKRKEVLRIEELHKRFGALVVLNNVSFNIYKGEFICALGPSGCGKTTILRIIAQLVPLDEGRIFIHGNELITDSYLSDLSVVFQEPRLLYWRTVEENVKLALELKKGMVSDRDEVVVSKALSMVGLADFADAFPHELSGGMKQRAALARALVTEPSILLMDEPLTGLDLRTREDLQDEILRIWKARDMTAIFVTHDPLEVIYMADRIIVLSDRPTRVKEVLKVSLERPRNRDDPRIKELEKYIRDLFDYKNMVQ
ncbi:MAG TPA: ABC transporter ATP-binding protein [Methanophagales archaeon]|nr:ABC transporter ATP-binding protein [Methanophagales archaeon]